MEISFEPMGSKSHGSGSGRKILAARIQNYLLEQSRVTAASKGERSYHIFYQFLAGIDQEQRERLELQSPEHYHYLKQSECYSIDGVNDHDADEFAHLERSWFFGSWMMDNLKHKQHTESL